MAGRASVLSHFGSGFTNDFVEGGNTESKMLVGFALSPSRSIQFDKESPLFSLSLYCYTFFLQVSFRLRY